MILPTIRQIQIVADTLKTAKEPRNVESQHLIVPWRDYYKWCLEWIQEDPDTANPLHLDHDFFQAFAAYSKDFLNHYQLIKDGIHSPTTYPSADQVLANIPDLGWIWRGWLLRRMPSLVVGVSGTGKSYLALDLAYRIIAGTQFPDGQPVENPGRVLYVDAENTPSILKRRLSVWPQDMVQRLHLMLPQDDRILIDFDEFADRDRLSDMAWDARPTLIIVDSYGSCTLKSENKKEDVQFLLAFFNQLAKDYDCGVLIIHHLRKSANTGHIGHRAMTIDDIRGSSHIPAMSRHVLALQFVPTGPDASPADPRRLWVMKTNAGAPPKALGLAFAAHPENTDVAQLTYGDAPQPFKEPTKLEQCADWILAELKAAGEPIKPAALIESAKRDGYYSSLIYRARKLLDDLIVDTRAQRRHPQNAWALAEWVPKGGDGNCALSQDTPTWSSITS